MKRTAWVGLSAIVLAACAQVDPGFERGVEQRPAPGNQATLPPPWTPTPIPPTRVPLRGMPPAIAAEGPWLLYCDQHGYSALMDADGPGRGFSVALCMSPQQVAGATALAMKYGWLVQFPRGEQVRRACCLFGGWSAAGDLALLSNLGLSAASTELIVYDVAADQLRPIVSSEHQITPLGLSPGGSWAIYLEQDGAADRPPARQPAASVMAASTDGRVVRELYRLYDAETIDNSVLGWLSESSLLMQRSEEPCNLVPQHLELLHVDLNEGVARHIADKHSYAAFDPASHSVLLQELPRGPCSAGREAGRLLRLSAADGWKPQEVGLPAEWGDDWAVSQIQWHPGLARFSARVGENRGGAPLHLITLGADGAIEHDFDLAGAQVVASVGLFPSPDGAWIVVSGSAPHGTRLYDRNGQPIKDLSLEGGHLGNGVRHVQWLPGDEVVYMTEPEGSGVYRAAAEQGWDPALVEPEAQRGSALILLQSPERPFRRACEGGGHTRLAVGEQVMVSFEPPLANRLRSLPSVAGEVVGALQPGERAEIVGGPACDATYVWWELQPAEGGRGGWAAEGDAQGAWLLPLGAFPSPAPTPTPVPRPPSPTPPPLPTPTPGLLDARRLSPQGPWLLGIGSEQPIGVDSDGSRRAALRLNGALNLAADFASGGSEVGAWLAFRTHEQFLLGPNYLLRIFRLPNTESTFTVLMLNDALAERAGYPWESGMRSTDPDLLAVAHSPLLWSPNGRYLAFVGALEGPSADVYAFDTRTDEVMRLTDGPRQAVLMGWSPDSRWVVHMEAEFAAGRWGPEYEPRAVWAADVQGGPARLLYPSRGQLGDAEAIIGWRSDRELVAVERDAFGQMGRLAQVNVETGVFKTLWEGEVASAAVDPASGTVAFVPDDPAFFPPQGHAALERPTSTPSPPGTLSQGGIYLLRRGRDLLERLPYEEWYLAFASMQWSPAAQRFFGAWSVALSFTADGKVDQVFDERYLPLASPDGAWLVFPRPPHFPGIAVYAADGGRIYEVTGLGSLQVAWKRDSSGFYLFSPAAGVRFFDVRSRSLSIVQPAPGFRAGGLRLVYP